MQETWVGSLIQEDPTGFKDRDHIPQPLSPCSRAWEPLTVKLKPQLLKPVHPRAAAAAAAKSLHSCLTLCDPIDGLLPGSSVPGILQVRTLEWVAISFSNA